MKSLKIFAIVVTLVVVAIAARFLWTGWGDVSGLKEAFKGPQIIKIEVRLNNLCELRDDVFVVLEPETGITAPFQNGIAKLKLREDRAVKLAVSSVYPEFEYSGPIVQVKEKMELVADCNASPRQGAIFDALRDQFKPE
ncbi:hypothetical protein OA101_02660 [Alphaproteobacteria bacterium]|nr:hypothetical protein [Alphaproteobacteria bacterium]